MSVFFRAVALFCLSSTWLTYKILLTKQKLDFYYGFERYPVYGFNWLTKTDIKRRN